MSYNIKNIDLYALISKVALLLMALLVIWFFYGMSSKGLEHGDFVNSFTSQCESKGGKVKMQKSVNGWPQPECLNNGLIINIELIQNN